MAVTETPSYEVVETERGFEVMSPGGYSTLVCSTEENARHYVLLLSEAFQAGYKSGYRAAKQAQTRNQ